MTNRNTIRKLLDDEGSDWETGTVILQKVGNPDHPGLGETTNTVQLFAHGASLDQDFSLSKNRLACLRFMARNASAYYIPPTLDDPIIISKLNQDIDSYLELDTEILYLHC